MKVEIRKFKIDKEKLEEALKELEKLFGTKDLFKNTEKEEPKSYRQKMSFFNMDEDEEDLDDEDATIEEVLEQVIDNQEELEKRMTSIERKIDRLFRQFNSKDCKRGQKPKERNG